MLFYYEHSSSVLNSKKEDTSLPHEVRMLSSERFVVYGGTGYHHFDSRVLEHVNKATGLDLDFSHIKHSMWTDSEPGFRFARPEKIKDRHVIVFSCPITAKLYVQLQDIVVAAHHQYDAASVTVVMSFLRSRRMDHPEKTKEISRLQQFMLLLKFWGADRLVLCEPHNIANTQQFCDQAGLELFVGDPTRLFANAIMGLVQTLGQENVVVYSPDFGSGGRAMNLARAIGAGVVASPKRRLNGRVEAFADDPTFLARFKATYGDDIPVSCNMSDVADKHVLMREDEVASGSTANKTVGNLKAAGAKGVHLLATHPVCTWGWKNVLLPDEEGEAPPFTSIWFGNTRPRGFGETEYEGSTGGEITTVDMSPIVAETLIRAMEGIKD